MLRVKSWHFRGKRIRFAPETSFLSPRAAPCMLARSTAAQSQTHNKNNNNEHQGMEAFYRRILMGLVVIGGRSYEGPQVDEVNPRGFKPAHDSYPQCRPRQVRWRMTFV